MDMYMVGKVVGVGSYGKVRAAWHRLTGAKVAIKTYDKAKLKDPAHWKRVHSEIKIMEQVVSPPRIGARIHHNTPSNTLSYPLTFYYPLTFPLSLSASSRYRILVLQECTKQ